MFLILKCRMKVSLLLLEGKKEANATTLLNIEVKRLGTFNCESISVSKFLSHDHNKVKQRQYLEYSKSP